MESSTWLPLQALGTLAAVIAFAFWSWRRTKRMREKGEPKNPSALAREAPDPAFHPDSEVTDPYHVTDAHPEDARHGGLPRAGSTLADPEVAEDRKPTHGTADRVEAHPEEDDPRVDPAYRGKVKTFENR